MATRSPRRTPSAERRGQQISAPVEFGVAQATIAVDYCNLISGVERPPGDPPSDSPGHLVNVPTVHRPTSPADEVFIADPTACGGRKDSERAQPLQCRAGPALVTLLRLLRTKERLKDERAFAEAAESP